MQPRDASPTLHPVAWIVAAGAILALPVLLFGFPHRTGDGAQHEIWYANFIAELAGGEVYPRWLPAMNGGLGSPVFFFYPPLSFYVAGLFHPFFAEDVFQWRALSASAALGLVGSGLTAYLWLRESTAREIAAIVAIVYMALPYHLAVDLHLRGALPEFWAFVTMPLVLYATTRAVQGNRRGVALLAVSYALLIMTHAPTTLIFSWVPPVYALFIAPRQHALASFARTVAGMAIGACLAGIYLVPALTTQDYVSMAAMVTGKFDYANGFFFAHFGGHIGRDGLERTLFWVAVATAGAGLLTWPWRVDRRQHVFWTIVLVTAMFMMFPISEPVYALVPLLPRIQFPWRFNALLAVATCALLPAVLQWVPAAVRSLAAQSPRLYDIAHVAAGVVLLGWTLLSYNPLVRSPEVPSWERKRLNLDAREYRPRWATQDIAATLAESASEEGGRVRPVAIVAGSGSVSVLERAARRIVLEVATTGSVVEVRQFYYPGWEAMLATGERLAVEPSIPAGLIRIAVPDGARTIVLRLGESWAERLGHWLSLLGAVAVCWLALRPGRMLKSST